MVFFGLFPGLSIDLFQAGKEREEKSAECPQCTLSKCCSPLVLFAVIIGITYYILSSNCLTCRGYCAVGDYIVKLPGQSKIQCIQSKDISLGMGSLGYQCNGKGFLTAVTGSTALSIFSQGVPYKTIQCVPTLPSGLTNDLSDGWLVLWSQLPNSSGSTSAKGIFGEPFGYFLKLLQSRTNFKVVPGGFSPCLSDPIICGTTFE